MLIDRELDAFLSGMLNTAYLLQMSVSDDIFCRDSCWILLNVAMVLWNREKNATVALKWWVTR